jgi:hypothetical protein
LCLSLKKLYYRLREKKWSSLMNVKVSYLTKLCIWLVILKVLMIGAILLAGIGLMPEEAQYWTWSKALSYGYYSKPLAIAWEIATGCLFFGDTELGVRFGALILSFALSIGVFYLAKWGGIEERKAFWAAIAFSLTPLGVSASFLATTDCGFVLFWTFAAAVFAKELYAAKNHSFITIGILIGLGAFFKWATYLLWIPIIGFAIWQHRLVIGNFIIGFLISLIALIPSIIWNLTHEGATFRHVFRSIMKSETAQTGGNPLGYIIAQFGLASPILFVLIIIAIIGLARQLKKLPASVAFYWWTTVGMFVFVFALSCFKKVHGNWAVFAFPTAFPLLLAYAAMQKESFMRWIQVGIAFSVLLLAFVFMIPTLETTDKNIGIKVPYKLNPWKAGLGWKRLGKGLTQAGYDPEKHFLFSDRYQMASILSFYGPEQKRAYFLNVHGLRKNQFSFWPQMKDEQHSKTGYYVTVVEGEHALDKAIFVQRHMREVLKDYFTEVAAPLVLIPLYEANKVEVKVAIVIRCEGYTSNIPQAPLKY